MSSNTGRASNNTSLGVGVHGCTMHLLLYKLHQAYIYMIIWFDPLIKQQHWQASWLLSMMPLMWFSPLHSFLGSLGLLENAGILWRGWDGKELRSPEQGLACRRGLQGWLWTCCVSSSLWLRSVHPFRYWWWHVLYHKLILMYWNYV